MNARSRRHHYVPKVLQRRFADQSERLFYATREDVSSPFSSVEVRNISSAFRERDLFTVLQRNLPSDVVERKFYGSIDDYLGNLIPEVILTIERGNVPRFRKDSKSALLEAMAILMKRTKDAVVAYDDADIGREILSGFFATAEERGSTIPESASLPHPKSLCRSARVMAQVSRPDAIIEALEELSVFFAVPETRHCFILGSRMIYRADGGSGTALDAPNLEIWFPLAPTVAIVLARNSDTPVFRPSRDWLRRFNEAI